MTTPLISSDYWDAIAQGFDNLEKGATAVEVLGAAMKMKMGIKDRRADKMLLAAVAASEIAERAKRFALEQRDKAREAERLEAERLARERAVQEKLHKSFDKAWGEHKERVRTGEFLKEYGDEPINEGWDGTMRA